RATAIATAVVLLACGVVTANDVRAWHDSETLFTRAIERTEPNVFALHSIASSMLVRGATAPAIEKLEQCVALQPRSPHVLRALGYALKEARRYDDAIKQLTLAMRIDHTDARTWNTLGHVCAD